MKVPQIARHVNADLLEKYYPVGGVRIEDDILVTEEGYENITTTPKGDEALRIINGEEPKGRCDKEKETKTTKKGWFW